MAVTYNTKRAWNTGNGSGVHAAGVGYRAIYTYNLTTLSADLTTSTAHDLFTNTCAVGETLYLFTYAKTRKIYVTVGTPRNGTVTFKWYYYKWDGTIPQTGRGSWVEFTPTSDASAGFTLTGERAIELPIESMPGMSCTNFIPYTGEGLTSAQATQGAMIKCVVATSSGVTEGGATNAAWQWDDNTLQIDGYASGTASGSLIGIGQIASIARSSNVVTITTQTPHGFSNGDTILVGGTVYTGATSFNGQTVIASVPTSTTLTFASTGENGTGVANIGTVVNKNVTSISRTSNVVTVTTAANHYLAVGMPVQVGNISAFVANAGAVRATNVVTITTTDAHGFITGQIVSVAGVGYAGATPFTNATATITVTGANTFTYAQTGENGTSTTGGTVAVTTVTGTFFVESVPSATTFTYTRIGENMTANRGSAYTLGGLRATGASWTVGARTNRYIRITGGTGAGQMRKITGNGADSLTVSLPWTTDPDNTSTYAVFHTFQDIKDADTAGGWGICTKDRANYTIKAHIRQTTNGHVSTVSENISIGTEDYGYEWTNAAGTYFVSGEVDWRNPDRTKNGSVILHYNSGCNYMYMQGNFYLYAGLARIFYYHGWYTLGTDNYYQNFIIQPYQGVIGGTATYKRATILNLNTAAATYLFTTPASVWDDVFFQNSMFSLDPGYHPTLLNCATIRNAGSNWTSRSASTAGQIKYAALTAINTVIPERTLWSVALTNTKLRTESFFKWTSDLNVKDTAGSLLADVNVEIRDGFGRLATWIDSTTTVAANKLEAIDTTGSWGQAYIDVVDGTKITTGAMIKIDSEVMAQTRVTNTLTLTRAQWDTHIAAHNMNGATTLPVYLSTPYLTTNSLGNTPQQTLLEVKEIWYGVDTPAPYNDAVQREISYNPYVFKLRKYGYIFQTITKAITSKDIGSAVMATNPFVVASSSAAAAYASSDQIEIQGNDKHIHVGAASTIQHLYDYSQYWASLGANMAYDEPIVTTDGINFTAGKGWLIEGAETYLASDGKILKEQNSGGTLTFAYAPVTLTGVVTGSTYRISKTSDNTAIFSGTAAGTTVNTARYKWSVDLGVTVRVRKAGYLPFEVNGTITQNGLSINVSQTVDGVYV